MCAHVGSFLIPFKPRRSTSSIETDLELPIELVSSIRTFLLSQADFDKAVKKGSPPKPKVDADVAKWACKVLEKRLSEYPTSIEVSLATAITSV